MDAHLPAQLIPPCGERSPRVRGKLAFGSTEDVLAEVVARFRDSRPSASGSSITQLRGRLVANLDEVIDDYDVLPWMIEGDAGDGHVRAACVGGAFDMLLTNDTVLLADAKNYPHIAYEPICPEFAKRVNTHVHALLQSW